MRILIVDKEPNLEFGRMGHRYRLALESLGHTVKNFCYRKYKFNKSPPTKRIIDYLLIQKVKSFHPDILLVFKGESLSSGTIKKISNIGVKTANWANDEPFGELLKSNKINNVKEYDYFFVFDEIFINRLKEENESVFQLPPSADPFKVYKESIPLAKRKYLYDVSLVGSKYKNREILLKQLKSFNLAIAGPSWKNTLPELKPFVKNSKYLSIRQMVRFFNLSKIVLNNYYYHVENPNVTEPHNSIPQSRTFELPASKSFQICENVRGLSDYFELGKEIVVYNDIEDLKEKISYYLKNPSERIKIIEAGYERVVKEHTPVHRMRTMLKIMNCK